MASYSYDNAGLMRARLYNRATGLFTSMDPVAGANDTAYNYPNNPISNHDISGNRPGPHQAAFCSLPWNRLVCYAGLRWRGHAIKEAARVFGLRDGKETKQGNAFRHAYWMALIVWHVLGMGGSYRKTPGRARGLGKAHERDDRRPMDAEGLKDIYNNAIGTRIGKMAFNWGWSKADISRHIQYLASMGCRGADCLQIYW